jgi:hypothetical protein
LNGNTYDDIFHNPKSLKGLLNFIIIIFKIIFYTY